jgi:hypothetical protein
MRFSPLQFNSKQILHSFPFHLRTTCCGLAYSCGDVPDIIVQRGAIYNLRYNRRTVIIYFGAQSGARVVVKAGRAEGNQHSTQ